ncbi:MAG TPA: Flp family type IVb pilin [Acetobacteraceae bacterium]|nr:Flp family type IVb pilin [Acetobacteraceae bacterium]
MLNDLIARAYVALMNRKGVTAAEYAVLAVGIVIVVAGAAALLGSAISNTFSTITNRLNAR